MRTYKIPLGTSGLLIIQEKDMDVTTENFSVRKNLNYTDENVLVEPARCVEFGKLAYERGSMAARLAAAGYFVFSNIENQESRYMIAIPSDSIQISQLTN